MGNGDFEGKFQKNLDLWTRHYKKKFGDGVRLITGKKKPNYDENLVMVQWCNEEDFDILLKRDTHFDKYVIEWLGERALAPLEYLLKPGKKVILGNAYVIPYAVGRPDGFPIRKLIRRYQKTINGKRTFDY